MDLSFSRVLFTLMKASVRYCPTASLASDGSFEVSSFSSAFSMAFGNSLHSHTMNRVISLSAKGVAGEYFLTVQKTETKRMIKLSSDR